MLSLEHKKKFAPKVVKSDRPTVPTETRPVVNHMQEIKPRIVDSIDTVEIRFIV